MCSHWCHFKWEEVCHASLPTLPHHHSFLPCFKDWQPAMQCAGCPASNSSNVTFSMFHVHCCLSNVACVHWLSQLCHWLFFISCHSLAQLVVVDLSFSAISKCFWHISQFCIGKDPWILLLQCLWMTNKLLSSHLSPSFITASSSFVLTLFCAKKFCSFSFLLETGLHMHYIEIVKATMHFLGFLFFVLLSRFPEPSCKEWNEWSAVSRGSRTSRVSRKVGAQNLLRSPHNFEFGKIAFAQNEVNTKNAVNIVVDIDWCELLPKPSRTMVFTLQNYIKALWIVIIFILSFANLVQERWIVERMAESSDSPWKSCSLKEKM